MKNLLTLTDLTRNEIRQILEVATQMRRIVLANYKKGPQLLGHVVAGLWKKPCVSATAFQLATTYLSGTPCSVFGAEDEYGQLLALDNMGVNTVVVGCDNDGLLRTFVSRAHCSVINGGSAQSDPVGVLADLMTLSAKLDGLNNLHVLTVGNRDVNKIQELNHCLRLFGSDLIWYLPADDFVTAKKGVVIDKITTAFLGADAVIDLGLTSFSDPAKYYGSNGGITLSLMEQARIDCPLLGCRNVTDNLGIREYAHNAVATRDSCYVSVAMALLYLLKRD